MIAGDLQDEQQCRRIVEQTKDELGRIDVLVNNAAYQQRFEAVEEVTTEEWERTVRTNVTATFWMCREAVKAMEPGASIINVASIQAREPSANLLAYATTKGALVTYSQALSGMLASRGIRVNVVAPGPVWTPLVAATTDADKLSAFGGDTPLGPAGAAGRARAGLRVPRLAGSLVHHGSSDPCDGRRAVRMSDGHPNPQPRLRR